MRGTLVSTLAGLLVKQQEYLAGGQSAYIVLRGRVPIALTNRADKPLRRLVSCASAMLVLYIGRLVLLKKQGKMRLARTGDLGIG